MDKKSHVGLMKVFLACFAAVVLGGGAVGCENKEIARVNSGAKMGRPPFHLRLGYMIYEKIIYYEIVDAERGDIVEEGAIGYPFKIKETFPDSIQWVRVFVNGEEMDLWPGVRDMSCPSQIRWFAGKGAEEENADSLETAAVESVNVVDSAAVKNFPTALRVLSWDNRKCRIYADSVAVLLKAGADWRVLTEVDKSGELITSFSICNLYGPLLMDYGMPVNIRDRNGQTFLMRAADFPYDGDRDVVIALLDPPQRADGSKREAADVNLIDNKGRSALMLAKGPTVIETLLRHGADPNIADSSGITAMHHQLYRGTRRMLAGAGADVNAVDHAGFTPLMRGLTDNLGFRYTLIEELIDLGADPTPKTFDGKSAVYFALKNENKIRKMVLAAAKKQDISAAKKIIRKEMRNEFAAKVMYSLYLIAFVILSFCYMGFTVANREKTYRDNPQKNWVGTVNAGLAGFAVGTTLTFLFFLYLSQTPTGIGYYYYPSGLGYLILGLIVAPFVGVITGIITARKHESFKKDAFLYYAASTITAAIPVCLYFILKFAVAL